MEMVKLAGRNDMWRVVISPIRSDLLSDSVCPTGGWTVSPYFLRFNDFFSLSLVVWLIFLLKIKTNALASGQVNGREEEE